MKSASISLLIVISGFTAFMTSVLSFAKEGSKREPRVIYPKKTDLDFEGLRIQGEVRNPGEFYFQRRPEEKFDSLVKPRPHFHKEMLRDIVMGK